MLNQETLQTLITTALSQRDTAYAPYSNFHVGAAILTKCGKIFTGCNIENSSYPSTMCADRIAIFKALSEGYRDFSAICIAGGKTGEEITDYCAPCGTCRQVFVEFCDPYEFQIIIAKNENDYIIRSLAELLPLGFNSDNLI